MDIKQTKGIIDGFHDDFVEISKEFNELFPALRLRDFFHFWNERSLDCLFANRFDPRELLEAITAVNQLLVNLMTESYSSQSTSSDNQTLVALYFALCLFVKQPVRFRRRLRMTIEDVVSIKKFISELLNPGINLDTQFTFEQLLSLGAIDLVEERAIYGPSMLIGRNSRKHELERTEDDRQNSDSIQFLRNKIEPTLYELERLYTPYLELRSALNIDETNTDLMVDVKSDGTVVEFIEQAKALIQNFEARHQ